METKELMLDDIVFTDFDSKHKNEPYKIERIWRDNVYGISPCFEHPFMRYGSEIRPIPITEDMFERNGWLHRRKGNYGYFGKRIIINYSSWENSAGNTKIKVCFWGNGRQSVRINRPKAEYIEVQLSFVHELHHVLRLCGLHDLADNFKVR